MEEKIDQLSLIAINVKTVANGVNKISDLITELKTNKIITDITGDIAFKITAIEEETQLLQALDYQLTIELLNPNSNQTEEEETTKAELKSDDNPWTTTFKVNMNNELTQADKNQFNEIFTMIEQKLNTYEFLPAKIITVTDLEENVRKLIFDMLKPYEKFTLVKLENKSERFKANDYLYQNGEGINFNIILKTKYNKKVFEKQYNINLKKWESWDIIRFQYINEIKEKLAGKIKFIK